MKSKEDEAIFLLQNSIDKFSKVRSYATEISRLCDEISLIKSDLPEMSLGEETAVSERILSAENLLEDLIAGVRANVFHMYWVLTEPEDFSESQSSLPELTSDFFEKTKAIFDVKAVVDDGCLFIKIPLLWSRYLYHTKSKHYTKSSDYLSWFDRELNQALSKIDDDIPHMEGKHFSYVFVIPDGKMTFADNDNYDTKHITDVISQHIGTTDSGLTTSFSSMSIREGALTVGTYIAVTPSFGNPPRLQVLVNQFLSRFCL